MSDSPPAPPAPAAPATAQPREPLAVVCDRCRATGIAGDPEFAGIADLLAFTPVPVRAHVNNWTAEHQRAFIAALALTGSVNQAARSIGRYSAGADRLRKAPGGRAFAEAWDAALEIARERELAALQEHSAEFAREWRERSARSSGDYGPYIREIYGDDYDPDDYLDGHVEMVDARGRIRDKLLYARRLYLLGIAGDPDRRAAWELLAGPVDWDKAARMEPQDNEPAQGHICGAPKVPNLRQPDMLLCHEDGLLGELAGGFDLVAEIRAALRGSTDNPAPLPAAEESSGEEDNP